MLNGDQLTEARHKLSAGRIIAIRMLPYFETTLMAMVTVEMPGFGKFTVDKRWRFYYDPELCLTMTTQEIAAEWIHNVEHIVRKHEERFAALEGHTHDHQKYNAAADGAINSDLKEQGIIMPNPDQQFYAEPNEQFPMWKKNMSAEEMYFSAGGGGSNNPDPDEPMKNSGESEEDNDSGDSSEGAGKGNTGEASDTEENDVDSSDEATDSPSEEDAGSPSKGSDDTQENGNPSKEDKDSDGPSQGGSEDEKHSSENDSEDADATNNENSDSEAEDGQDDSASGESGDSGNNTETDGTEDSSEDDEEEEEGDITLVRDGVVENLQEIGSKDKSSDEKTSNDEESDSSDPSGDPSGDSGDNESSSGDTNGKPLPDCGSAVGGPKRDYESNDENDGSVDDLSADTLLKETAKAIQAYAESNPGKVPGGLLREAKNILEPQIDWIDEFLSLLRAVTAKHSGYTNYSYARPSRRSSGSAFILPAMRNPPAPEVAIILDTSGSMDEGKEIAMALAEMEDIINRVARFSETQSIKIINCDVASTEVAIIRDLNDFEIIGGGGTDMRVGIKAASKLKPRMDIIMTITDGFTPWPKEVPSDNPYATYITLLVGGSSSKRATPPEWMTTLEVKIPQKRSGLKM